MRSLSLSGGCRRVALVAVAAAALMSVGALAACSNDSATTSSGETKTVVDAHGEVEIPAHPQRVAAFDNRIFAILEDWDVDLVSAPIGIIPDSITKYQDKSKIRDVGNFKDPDLEQLVAAKPDLIITGYRLASSYDKMKQLLPNVPILDLSFDKDFNNPDKDAPKTQTTEDTLKDITSLIGEVFDKQDEAKTIEASFDKAKNDARQAYNPDQKVMGLVTSGGEIGYAAPSTGRSVGPLFDMIGLTPSYNHTGSTNHKGDDISVEAIANSKPDWIIVLDRDAAISADEPDYKTAKELIKGSEAMKNVPAVQQDHIIYMPADFYETEDILAYTDVLGSVGTAFREAT